MSYEVAHGGWDWVDVTEPNELDRSKIYRIEVGRQLWHLKYRGLNEWFCYRNAGDSELPANEMIEAGCHVYVKRDPIRFEGLCRVSKVNGEIVLSGLEGPLPDALFDSLVNVVLVENTEVLDPLIKSLAS